MGQSTCASSTASRLALFRSEALLGIRVPARSFVMPRIHSARHTHYWRWRRRPPRALYISSHLIFALLPGQEDICPSLRTRRHSYRICCDISVRCRGRLSLNGRMHKNCRQGTCVVSMRICRRNATATLLQLRITWLLLEIASSH